MGYGYFIGQTRVSPNSSVHLSFAVLLESYPARSLRWSRRTEWTGKVEAGYGPEDFVLLTMFGVWDYGSFRVFLMASREALIWNERYSVIVKSARTSTYFCRWRLGSLAENETEPRCPPWSNCCFWRDTRLGYSLVLRTRWGWIWVITRASIGWVECDCKGSQWLFSLWIALVMCPSIRSSIRRSDIWMIW